MRVRARARQRGVEFPLVISDHADWDGLTATITATGASEIWVTHGQEDALVHWSKARGLKARPLAIVGYGDEDESDTTDLSASTAQNTSLSVPSPLEGEVAAPTGPALLGRPDDRLHAAGEGESRM